ncbi:3-octaprenyl-4-hydroxybenzoate carboxy-lyase [Methanobrevibacter cuticularis]|uniref:Anhydromevalonate phosphate decarboxylase n=1 Tax=Methanobrevibacter cuticularis TaxID=47311 RepID=A0A166D0Q9_9EURY|nr:UbiD family decarboxylase [Methanobrevibacter cuticularis]KZX15076.1 3-octaprenyl-4-hydroxybenzoate carboxy-lyase [Methanobrevibacter cuticularis]
MENFLKLLEEEYRILRIKEEVSTKYEAAKILREHPTKTVILSNVEGYDIPIISGICNTREKIARSLGCTISEITQKIINSTTNPQKISKYNDLSNSNNEYTSKKADLNKIPILTHYKRDGGPYITAGVVFAKDPETGIQNASIHRMLVLGKNKLAIRIVPRNLYTYFQKSKKMNKDLDIAIAIGMDPTTLLATTTSIPIDQDEMEVANTFKDGNLNLMNLKNVDLKVPEAEIIFEGKILANETAKEGPFVDLTDTYDVIRDEPVIELNNMHIKENAMYHAILPAGFEHKLLQGMPQEPRIFQAVQNTVPTVKNVVLTEGGCCWLHSAIAIEKQTQGDGKNAILAALAAHPSLKHAVVVDTDVDIFDPQDIEYAIATRVKGDDDIIIVPKARGSSLDPVALPDGTTTKVGVDATKLIGKEEKFERVSLSE